MYFPVLARVNRTSFFPTVKHGDKQDCMLLRLLIWAYGPYSISCARKANEDCIRVCRCLSVLFLKYGMQYITCSPPPTIPFVEGIIFQTCFYMICIGTLDFTHLIQETVKHLL